MLGEIPTNGNHHLFESLSSYFNESPSLRYIGDGCHAAGFIATFKDKALPDVFVRMIHPVGFGHDLPPNRLQSMLEARKELPGSLKTHAVLAITPDGMIVDIPQISEVVTISDVIPSDACHVGTFMRQEKEILQDHVNLAKDSTTLALSLANLMAEIHKGQFEEDENLASSLYQRAFRAIIHDPELTVGVIDFANPPTPWMSHQDGVILMADMEKVRYHTGIHPERLRRIHGDFWTNNAYVRPNGELLMTDCRLGWGDPAIDAGWFIGEFLMQDLVRFGSFNHEFTTAIKAAMDRYIEQTGDRDIYQFMPLPYAFQTLAEATFTPGITNDHRRILFTTGIGALQDALSDYPFSFDRLTFYTQNGLVRLSENQI